MELILHHRNLPRPVQRGFAHSYLLHQRIASSNRRLDHDHRVFPEFSPAETSHLFTAAAAASAATALSLETLKAQAARLYQFNYFPEEDSNDEQFQTQNPLKIKPPVPSSVAEIWSTAWAGLEDNDGENEIEPNKFNYKDDDDGSDSVPITTPLLWLQGLRGDARRKLLALSLAALESAIKNKRITNTADVTESCNLILKISTAAAAKAWLGYLPTVLEKTLIEEENTSKAQQEQPQQRQQQLDSANTNDDLASSNIGVDWYALEERIGVYCSVIRLLQSTHIVTSPSSTDDTRNGKTGTITEQKLTQGKFSIASATTSTGAALSLRAAAEASLYSSATLSSSTSCTTDSHVHPSAPIINGWRATQAGTKSQSQLFSLAPSILHDMAVRVADVVAAAYLVEAAQGTWSPSLSVSSYLPLGGGTSSRKKVSSNAAASGALPPKLSSLPQNNNDAAIDKIISALMIEQNEQEATEPSTSSSTNSTSASSTIPTTSLEASWWPVFAHPRISSTRQLQRFSNRLLLSRWVDTTFHSVVAAYDDRLPLFTLCPPRGLLRIRHAPVRRAAELSALTGLRYYVSLMLEAVDAAAPTLRVLWERATGAVAWLLTYGLGKGLGLVWKGLKIGVASASASNTTTSRNTTSNNNNTKSGVSNRASVKRRATPKSDEASGTGGTSGAAGGGSLLTAVPAN